MKLVILLAAVAWSSGAKLDRNYLPPSYAQTSGGNGNFLQTPVSVPEEYQNGGFGQNNGVTGVSANGFGLTNNYQQNGNDFAQNGIAEDKAFSANDNFSQNGNSFSQDNGFAQNGNNGFNGFNNLESRPERAQAAFERNAAILRQDSSNDGETFSYAYETENGIVAEENGVATNGVEAQGGYSYTGDDGQVYSVRYTADQNGFQPQGDHLPTPPPIPEEILKALEQNARDEANGIYDDGSYNEAKYDSGDNGQYNDNFDSSNNGFNYNNGNNFNAAANLNGNAENALISNDDGAVVTNNALLSDQGASFGNQGAGFGRQNDVNKAYLPPFERSGNRQTQAVSRQFNRNNGFTAQPSNAFHQTSRQISGGNANGVEKAYLSPDQQFGQRSQIGGNRRYQTPSTFGNQVPNGNQRNLGSRNGNGVNQAYLPPFEANPNAPSSIYDQPQNFRQRSQGRKNGANREYLPPSANQRSNVRAGFSRRPSFSATNGYQY